MKEGSEERPWFSFAAEGPPPKIPVAAMLQVSLTSTNSTSGADPSEFPRNNGGALQQASLFYAGRIVEHFGAFVQWSYDGIAHHSSIDNVDLRFAGNHKGGDFEVANGLTVNNHPAVSDIYNTPP